MFGDQPAGTGIQSGSSRKNGWVRMRQPMGKSLRSSGSALRYLAMRAHISCAECAPFASPNASQAARAGRGIRTDVSISMFMLFWAGAGANSSRLDRAYAWEMGAMSSARMRAKRAKRSSPFDIYSTANKNSADRPSERVTRIPYCPLGSLSITSHLLYINPSIASLSFRIVIVRRSLEIDTFAWLSSSPQDAGASGSINCSVHQIGSLTAPTSINHPKLTRRVRNTSSLHK